MNELIHINEVSNELYLPYKPQINSSNNNQTEQFNKTINQLFEEQVEKTPNKIALIYEDQQLTYRELNNKSNQLAIYIRAEYKARTTQNLTADTLITLCLDRSLEMIIGIFAVLKAGGAYVPIDPSYPQDRIDYILEDTKSELVLTLSNVIKTSSTNPKLPKDKILLIDLEQELYSGSEISSRVNLFPESKANNLAYVIYTSGTTGKPKGVMIEHQSVINFINNIPFKENNLNALLVSEYVFDVSIFGIYSNLLSGAKLFIPKSHLLQDIQDFNKYIVLNNIEKIYLPAALLKIHYLAIANSKCKYLLTGVESLSYKYTNALIAKGIQVINGYGPTEATVCSTFYQADIGIDNEILPIGKPLSNTQTYILDQDLTPVPFGVVGELYIGGIGLARGYLNLPELTNEKFIKNMFMDNKSFPNASDRLYKTGDLCRYKADGNIEYIGRNDDQVKIRGYRIELSEIEIALSKIPEIKQVCVLAQSREINSEQDKYIVGYYILNLANNESVPLLTTETIYSKLLESLPEYMIPAKLVQMDTFPLTINGKIDKKSLPVPDFQVKDNNFVPPITRLEKEVCAIFARILDLNCNDIGVNSDFFAMGGSSLSAIKLVSELQNIFEISFNDIFKFKTPKNIINKLALIPQKNLYKKFNNIIDMYEELSSSCKLSNSTINLKIKKYHENISSLKLNLNNITVMQTILLTGSTGYLGCNILYQLLTTTNNKIILLIRDPDDSLAFARIRHKFKFYFQENLAKYKSRIKVLSGNLEEEKLGLSDTVYDDMVASVDSIIHAAALVKHYGMYNNFYAANVTATINLLNFSLKTELKDFHYISTMSVIINSGYIPGCNIHAYTEDDATINMENTGNYAKTKYLGELEVIKYRNYGVNSSIYRVGNLSMNSKNFGNQENLTENAFFNKIKHLLKLGVIPYELCEEEISPVDYTALAITKMFNKKELSNSTYHLMNPNKVNLFKILSKNSLVNNKLELCDLEEFIFNINKNQAESSQQRANLESLFLHLGWFDKIDLDHLTKVLALSDKTDHILSLLDFKWPVIKPEMMNDIISKSLN